MITAKPLRHAVSDEVAQKLWAERHDTEGFLAEMRQRGAFQVESIGTLHRLAGLPVREAKDIVHFSATWADMRESSEAIHEAAWAALEELSREEAYQERLAS